MEHQKQYSTGQRARKRGTDAKLSPLKRRRKSVSKGPRRPRGREEVMAAVLNAATELFAAHGPASVSVRDIADLAHVNHALVHRHFGPKKAVLRAVLERTAMNVASIADRITNSREGMEQLFTAAAEHDNYYRALARAILDGEDPSKLQRDFPTIHKMIDLLRREQSRSRISQNQQAQLPVSVTDARVLIGATSALSLGWLLFEPFLLVATGLGKNNRSQVRACVVKILQVIIDSAISPSNHSSRRRPPKLQYNSSPRVALHG